MKTTLLPEIPFPAEGASPGEDFVMPCSMDQQRWWALDQLAPGNPALNVPFAVELKGPLDVETLNKALHAVIRRHEILRTSFAWLDGEVKQVISSEVRFHLQNKNLSSTPMGQRQERVLQEMNAEAVRPLSLTEAPIFRARLLSFKATDHVLMLTLHHSICDGWANGVLIREIGVYYQAILEGKPAALPELPIQYADYSVWQREWLKSPEFENELAFWEKHLAGSAPVLDLPTDHPRRIGLGHKLPALNENYLLPIRLTDEVRRMCQDLDATMFMVFFATFAVLLNRYTDQTRFILGTSMANRPRPELENLIGQFANPMMLRVDLADEPTFRELVHRLRDLLLGAMSHQDVPLESILDRLETNSGGKENPAIQALMMFQKDFLQHAQYGELAVVPLRWVSPGTIIECTLGIVERAEGICLHMEYNTEIWENATIHRMLRHFENLLEAVVENVDTPVSEMTLRTQEELVTCHERFGSSPTFTPNLQESLDRVAKSHAILPALTRGEQVWTFGDLARQTGEWAQRLATNLSPEDSGLGLILEQGPEDVVALLAGLQSGRPLAIFEPAMPRRDVEKEARRLGLTHLLRPSPQGVSFSSQTSLDKSYTLEEITVEKADSPRPETKKGTALTFVPRPGNESNLFHLSFEQLDGLIASLVASGAISPNSRVCMPDRLPPETWVEQLLATLTAGGTLVFPSQPIESSRHLFNLLREQRIDTLALAWPLNRAALTPLSGLDARRLALRRIIVDVNGAQVGDLLALQKRSENRWEWIGRFTLPNRPAAALARLIDGQWVIDRALAPSTLAVKDSHQQIVPFGVPGEIFIDSEPSGRVGKYRTDGRLALLSTIAGRIKFRGFTFDLEELEAHLWNHPNVQEVILVNRENTKADPVLSAYIAPIEAKPNCESVFRERLLETLPTAPTNVEVVLLTKLPRREDGRIDLEALPTPPPVGEALRMIVEARDAIELQLLTIWERVLPNQKVGIRDNFFDLGGNSFLAVRLSTEIEKAWSRRLPLRVIFHSPTIEQMANILRQEGWKASSSSLLNVQPTGTRPPLFCISGIGGGLIYYQSLAKYLGPDQPIYAFHSIDALLPENAEENEIRRNRLVETVQPYIEEIKTIQPIGPVHLCGHSWGGIVAYVLAQELLASGREVGFLGLFDTYCPGYEYRLPFLTRLKSFFGMSWSERMTRGYRYYCMLRTIWGGNFLMMMPAWVLPASWVKMKIIHTEAKKDGEAVENVELKSYSRKMTLFRGDYLSPWQRNDPDLGWNRWVSGSLDIIRVPGMHGNIVVEPQVQVLAKRLDESLKKAFSENKGKELI
jgi:non-ribosomal peptide synthetase component F/thioesterase domain-containing protein